MFCQRKRQVATAVAAASILLNAPAHAQMLEEVVVTATKRVEGLQDVPIALSVMSGDSIDELGMQSLADVSAYLPNVTISQGATVDNLFIRGVGSGINFGFEQSVGTFVDNVYFGRSRAARGRFVDIERVEVLKGPQSTLFGKNTIAGAVNITTARPTDEFEGYVDARYRTEYEGYAVEGVLSGPITENLRARLVGRYYEDDSFVDNPLPGGEGGAREDTTLRLVVDYDISDTASLSIKAEHNKNDEFGRRDVISTATPSSTALYRAFGDPAFESGDPYTSYTLGFDQAYMDRYNLPWKPALYDENESNILQATLDWELGDHTLRSITAYTDYEFTNEFDTDYSPLRLLNRGRTEEHEQFTQEFILSSPVGGSVEYLAGFFYQDESLTNNRHTIVSFAGLPPVEGQILNLVAGLLGLPPGFLPSTALDGDGLSFFDQDSKTWSVFSEFTFNLSDSMRLTVGARYSEDEKQMDKRGEVIDLSGTLSAIGAQVGMPGLFGTVYGPAALSLAAPHEFSRERNEDHFVGNVNLQFDATDNAMLYANISNGYKAGGFDEDNALGRLDVAEYEDETVVSVELGAKITLADGRGRLNIAAFQSDYEDVQVSTFDGNAAFVVGNAAEVDVTGVEFDLEYAISDSLTAKVAGAWLDATYASFKSAACNVQQVLDGRCAANGGVQDLSGKPLQFAPEYSANVNLRYVTPLTEGVELMLAGNYSYSDDTVVAADLDPRGIQDAYGKLDANITVRDAAGKWSVSLIGRNLTDETTMAWANDVPLGNFGFNNTFFTIYDAPQYFELQTRYNF